MANIKKVRLPGVAEALDVRDDFASHYLGTTTTALVDGTTSATVVIGGNNVTAVANDWVKLNGSADSFIYTGSAWVQFAAAYSLSADDGIKIENGVIKHTNAVTAGAEGFKTFAYDAQGHITGATDATTAQVDAINSGITSYKVGNYDTHLADTSNPHSVTATQVGLGNLTNDKQVKALSSTPTSGNIVTWGGDDATVADSGVAIATSIPGTGAADTAVPTSKAVSEYVASQFSGLDALIFKGTIGTGGTPGTLPATGYEAGWVYRVVEAGTYAGQACEVGDLVIAIKDYAAATASNNDWTVAQTNIDGAVTSSATSTTDGQIVVFDGTTGNEIKNSAKSIETTLTDSSDAAVPTSKAVATYVTGQIEGLDVTGDSSVAASKTISAWSETDGKVSITTQPIEITSSQVTDLSTDTIQPVSTIASPVSAIDTQPPTSAAPSGTPVTLFGYDSTNETLELYQVGVSTAAAVTLGSAQTFATINSGS